LSEKIMDGKKRLFCAACDLPIYENPVPATCLVAVDDRQRLLLVKRNVDPKKGLWCLPGGFMELGEMPEAAALREFQEETGLTGRIDMLLGVTANHSEAYETVLMIGFLIRSFEGALTAGDDAEDIGWYEPDRLPEIAFESHKRFIRIYYAAHAPARVKSV
jgi:8-oxo-dGTP diphosphatase